jgi:hypothetical protein
MYFIGRMPVLEYNNTNSFPMAFQSILFRNKIDKQIIEQIEIVTDKTGKDFLEKDLTKDYLSDKYFDNEEL